MPIKAKSDFAVFDIHLDNNGPHVENGDSISIMSDKLRRAIGARVRAARKSQGMSQSVLAEKIGRAEETISNIERGVTAPGVETLDRLARALDVPVMEFFKD